MILEIAILNVRTGQEPAFESAMKAARPLIAATPGFQSLEIRRSIDTPNRYLLVVEWQKLEDHTVGFRNRTDIRDGAICFTTSMIHSHWWNITRPRFSSEINVAGHLPPAQTNCPERGEASRDGPNTSPDGPEAKQMTGSRFLLDSPSVSSRPSMNAPDPI